jgi:hypothetical protein
MRWAAWAFGTGQTVSGVSEAWRSRLEGSPSMTVAPLMHGAALRSHFSAPVGQAGRSVGEGSSY